MLAQIPVAAGDRVLFLVIPDLSLLEEMSRRLGHGFIVCLGERDEVAEARKVARSLENVMFTPAEPDEIPWQDGFFNWVIDPGGKAAAIREIARVLAGGGEACLAASGEVSRDTGLVETEPRGSLRCFRKMPAPPRSNGLRVLN